MTVLAAVSNGRDILVQVSDSVWGRRDIATGRKVSTDGIELPEYLRSKLHPLSRRYPISVGIMGHAGSPTWGRARSVSAVFERCRARFDGEDTTAPALSPSYTMREVAERVAAELYETLAVNLRALQHHETPPEQLPPGHWSGGAMTGAHVAGFPGNGGQPEVWWIRVHASGVEDVVRKMGGGRPGQCGFAISPGAFGAERGYAPFVATAPASVEDAMRAARGIIEKQIAAYQQNPDTAGVPAAAPVQFLSLTPGRPPAPLEPRPAFRVLSIVPTVRVSPPVPQEIP